MYEGQITALLGHNGAGKTTTISMLTGISCVNAPNTPNIASQKLYSETTLYIYVCTCMLRIIWSLLAHMNMYSLSVSCLGGLVALVDCFWLMWSLRIVLCMLYMYMPGLCSQVIVWVWTQSLHPFYTPLPQEIQWLSGKSVWLVIRRSWVRITAGSWVSLGSLIMTWHWCWLIVFPSFRLFDNFTYMVYVYTCVYITTFIRSVHPHKWYSSHQWLWYQDKHGPD